MRRYTYLYHHNQNGFWEAHFPRFPKILVTAASMSEMKRKLDQALITHFQHLDRKEREHRAGERSRRKRRFLHIPKETFQPGRFYVGPRKYHYLCQRQADRTWKGWVPSFPELPAVTARNKPKMKGRLYARLEPLVRERGWPEETIQADKYYLHLDDLYREPDQRKLDGKIGRFRDVEDLR